MGEVVLPRTVSEESGVRDSALRWVNFCLWLRGAVGSTRAYSRVVWEEWVPTSSVRGKNRLPSLPWITYYVFVIDTCLSLCRSLDWYHSFFLLRCPKDSPHPSGGSVPLLGRLRCPQNSPRPSGGSAPLLGRPLSCFENERNKGEVEV